MLSKHWASIDLIQLKRSVWKCAQQYKSLKLCCYLESRTNSQLKLLPPSFFWIGLLKVNCQYLHIVLVITHCEITCTAAQSCTKFSSPEFCNTIIYLIRKYIVGINGWNIKIVVIIHCKNDTSLFNSCPEFCVKSQFLILYWYGMNKYCLMFYNIDWFFS